MGMELLVQRVVEDVSIRALLSALAETGCVCVVMMVDGHLVMPGSEPPPGWRDVRLRTPAGMVTVARRPGALAVAVFGNADAGLVDVQRRVAEALGRI